MIDTDNLRKSANAIYVVVAEDVAEQISKKLIEAADTIDLMQSTLKKIAGETCAVESASGKACGVCVVCLAREALEGEKDGCARGVST